MRQVCGRSTLFLRKPLVGREMSWDCIRSGSYRPLHTVRSSCVSRRSRCSTATPETVMKIFVAGGTAAIGLPLVRALCTLGHEGTGMTGSKRGVDGLRELGARASIADAFDPRAVRTAIELALPDVVIAQLTSLPANPADILKS